ncbi:MAG TPA: NifU family protein [Gemmataceae bacterium]|jgi:Fe-S cluster biogenesis protein NfuA|nr:NifU family protein [Gemmataceae bacterium]
MSDTHLKTRVENVLRIEIAPALELDGAGLEVLDVTDGIVRLRLNGACAGCPATIMSLVLSLEQELRARLPEVEYLEAVP